MAEDENYARLGAVLLLAYDQAAKGKGAVRHGGGTPFEKQPMQQISGLLGDNHGLLFQAIKKLQEGARFAETDRTITEYLGAINYIAGAIIYLQDKEKAMADKKLPTREEAVYALSIPGGRARAAKAIRENFGDKAVSGKAGKELNPMGYPRKGDSPDDQWHSLGRNAKQHAEGKLTRKKK